MIVQSRAITRSAQQHSRRPAAAAAAAAAAAKKTTVASTTRAAAQAPPRMSSGVQVSEAPVTTGHPHSDQPEQPVHRQPLNSTVIAIAVLVVAATSWAVFELIDGDAHDDKLSVVWWYSWITAVCTGLGSIPFFFFADMNTWWLGLSNAVAAGMMLSASGGLVWEGLHEPLIPLSVGLKHVAAGAVAGVAFMLAAKRFLDKYEHLKFSGLEGQGARKLLLILVVMTVHSFTEGIGLGVSFGGASGVRFGVFISVALAIHNIPEGLAICLVFVPRGVHPLAAALWAVFSSIPQPLMAVPAFWSTQYFVGLLPFGLGFAAGAMCWVAIFELLPEAQEELSLQTTSLFTIAAAGLMGLAQHFLK